MNLILMSLPVLLMALQYLMPHRQQKAVRAEADRCRGAKK